MSVTDEGTLSTPTEDYELPDSEFYYIENSNSIESIFKPILYCIIIFCGLIGNGLVLWILICFKKMNSVTDIYILSMALSDLLFIFSLPFVIYQIKDQWVFGNAMCKMLAAMYYTGYFSGIFFITVLSIDRYLAIVHAIFSLRYRTKNVGLFATFIIWTFSVLLSIPNLIVHQETTSNGFAYCAVSYPEGQIKNWTLFSYLEVNIFGFILPLAIIVFCYSYIIRTLQNSKSIQKKYAVRLILILIIACFLFWTPYNIVIFLEILDTYGIFGASSFTDTLKSTLDITQTISFAHCCLNPIIYCFAAENFKKHLYRMFSKLLKFLQVSKNYGPNESSGTDKMSSTNKETRSYFMDTVM